MTQRLTIEEQKQFALELLDWHGGMGSAVYAVGSCMLSDSDKGRPYSTVNHRGHAGIIQLAWAELINLKVNAKFPEAVTPEDEKECDSLAMRLVFNFS